MSRSQQYIVSIFDHLPKASLSDANQRAFDRIRSKIETSSDIVEELKTLFKVRDMSDVALSLLWIAEKVENDPSRLDPTNDEEALVFSMLQSALSGPESGQMLSEGLETPPQSIEPVVAEEAPAEPAGAFDLPAVEGEAAPVNTFDSFSSTDVAAESAAEPAAPAETGGAFDVFNAPPTEVTLPPSDFGVTPSEAPPMSLSTPELPLETPSDQEPTAIFHEQAAPPVAGGTGDEGQHAALFEKFIEALQNAADDRMALFDQLSQVSASAASGSGAEDYKEYSQLLVDLLKSLNDNQMLDDIRAMNMLSTAFDPFSQWAKADVAGREGLLFQGIEALKGFKALFE